MCLKWHLARNVILNLLWSLITSISRETNSSLEERVNPYYYSWAGSSFLILNLIYLLFFFFNNMVCDLNFSPCTLVLSLSFSIIICTFNLILYSTGYNLVAFKIWRYMRIFWQIISAQGVLLGLSNTAGVLAGVFGTAATGYILQRGIVDPQTNYFRKFSSQAVVKLRTPFSVKQVDSNIYRTFTGSWDDVFKVAVALYILGTLVWNFFSTGEKVLE